MIELTVGQDMAVMYALNGAPLNSNQVKYLVRKAVKSGDLVKLACEVCGDPMSVAHHPDNEDPLTVVWLCHAHHMRLHKYLKLQPKIYK